jgi:hypothetical protein
MATGRQAFGGQSAARTFDAILNKTQTQASLLRADLPHRLDAIIAKALLKPGWAVPNCDGDSSGSRRAEGCSRFREKSACQCPRQERRIKACCDKEAARSCFCGRHRRTGFADLLRAQANNATSRFRIPTDNARCIPERWRSYRGIRVKPRDRHGRQPPLFHQRLCPLGDPCTSIGGRRRDGGDPNLNWRYAATGYFSRSLLALSGRLQ